MIDLFRRSIFFSLLHFLEGFGTSDLPLASETSLVSSFAITLSAAIVSFPSSPRIILRLCYEDLVNCLSNEFDGVVSVKISPVTEIIISFISFVALWVSSMEFIGLLLRFSGCFRDEIQDRISSLALLIVSFSPETKPSSSALDLSLGNEN
nr:hypothetical protein Iba_chr14aCG15240 [Ipomoea batatas]